MKVIFIIPYFGKGPIWLSYFIKSCAHNPAFNWLIIGNLKLNQALPDNVRHIQASLDNINSRIRSKLSVKTRILNAYKLCDYRPAFYQLFSDYIEGYDFWGYCDLDMIFGDISNFLPETTMHRADIITASADYLSGPFTLYRNKESVNYLYEQIWRFHKRISDQKRHYCLDEKANYIGDPFVLSNSINKNSILRIMYRISRSIRFRFFKRLPYMQDISKLAFSLERGKKLRIIRIQAHRPDTEYYAKGITDWKLKWSKGRLIDLNDNKELLYFHFLKSKKNFSVQHANPGDIFYVTSTGITH